MERINTITSKTVTSIVVNLKGYLNDPLYGGKFVEELELYLNICNCTQRALNGRSDITLKLPALMQELLMYLELEGMQSPFYCLKSQTEKVKCYF